MYGSQSMILPPPVPLRYTLSSIEPQRLIVENEDLRRRNLDLELNRHKGHNQAGMSQGEMEGLRAEVEYLRGLAHNRLHEIEHWQKVSRDLRSPTELDSLKSQIERSVGNRLDQDFRTKMKAYIEELDRTKAENLVLIKKSMGLEEEIRVLRQEKFNSEDHIGRTLEQAVESKISQEARRLEDAHLNHDRKLKFEIADLRNQVAFLQRELDERNAHIRSINREYVENVVVRKENDTSALAAQYRSELDLTRLGNDKIIDSLTTGNRELMKRVTELETALSKQRIDHSTEMEQLKGRIKLKYSKMAEEL